MFFWQPLLVLQIYLPIWNSTWKIKLAPCYIKKRIVINLGCFSIMITVFFFLVVCMYWRKRRFFSLFLPFRGNDYKFNMGQNSKESKHSMDQYFKKLQHFSLKYMSGRKWGLAQSKNQLHQRWSSFILRLLR